MSEEEIKIIVDNIIAGIELDKSNFDGKEKAQIAIELYENAYINEALEWLNSIGKMNNEELEKNAESLKKYITSIVHDENFNSDKYTIDFITRMDTYKNFKELLLGNHYFDFYGGEGRGTKAITYWQKAADKKSEKVYKKLYHGRHYSYVEDGEYEKNLDKERGEALNHLGYAFENGLGVEKNYKNAFECYQDAVKKEYVPAMYNLGKMYEEGKGIEKDYDMSRILYIRASEQGSIGAMISLGNMYLNGNGVKQNYYIAKLCYQKAKKYGGKVNDAIKLCELHLKENGEEVVLSKEDVTKTVELINNYYREENEEWKKRNVTSMIIHSYNVPYSPLPTNIIKQVLEQDSNALYLLANACEDVKELSEKSMKYLELSGKYGNVKALKRLNSIYEKSENDKTKIIENLKLAAKLGSEEAALEVATAYFEGIKVPKDINEAKRWVDLSIKIEPSYAREHEDIINDINNEIKKEKDTKELILENSDELVNDKETKNIRLINVGLNCLGLKASWNEENEFDIKDSQDKVIEHIEYKKSEEDQIRHFDYFYTDPVDNKNRLLQYRHIDYPNDKCPNKGDTFDQLSFAIYFEAKPREITDINFTVEIKTEANNKKELYIEFYDKKDYFHFRSIKISDDGISIKTHNGAGFYWKGSIYEYFRGLIYNIDRKGSHLKVYEQPYEYSSTLNYPKIENVNQSIVLTNRNENFNLNIDEKMEDVIMQIMAHPHIRETIDYVVDYINKNLPGALELYDNGLLNKILSTQNKNDIRISKLVDSMIDPRCALYPQKEDDLSSDTAIKNKI